MLRSSLLSVLSFVSLLSVVSGQGHNDPGTNLLSFPEAELRPVEYRRPFKAPATGGIWTGERLASPLTGGLDKTFRPEIWAAPGSIRASALQPDGKLVLAGFFRTMNGERRSGLLRLHPGGAVDATLNVSVRGSVATVAVQTDGKIVIGGFFTAVNGVGRNNVARIYPDGSIDTSFDPGPGADNSVNDLLLQPDGKIVIAGSFLGVGNEATPHIARLNANGTRDTSFTSAIVIWPPSVVPSVINAIALQADGKIVAGGLVILNGMSVPTFNRSIVRFNADGSFDGSFNPPTINSNLFDVAVQPDGKLIMGGFFTTVGGVTRRYLARLNQDGSLDAGFDTGTDTNAPIRAVHLRPDGKILAGPISGIPAFGMARQFNPNGSLDRTFSTAQALTGNVNTVNVTSDEKIFVGGFFLPPTSGEEPNTAMLFDAAGNLEPNFQLSSTAVGAVRSIVVQPDAKVLIGGSFSRVNGARRATIARLNPDGYTDTTFNLQGPTQNSSFSAVQVTTLLRQPDGKILVSGSNINNGAGAAMVVRLNADGSWDSSFTQGTIIPPGTLASRTVARAISLQPDGKILLAYADPALAPGSPAGMVRLNANGSVDQSFASESLPFEKIALLPDGKILAAGTFAIGYVNSTTNESDFYYGVIRLNSDGSHDRTFRAGFISDLNVVGGRYTGAYALEVQQDGKILIGGQLYTAGSNPPLGVARLQPNGALDDTFQRHVITNAFDYPRVEAVASTPDGKVVAAGLFDSFGGAARSNIVLLGPDGSVSTDVSFSADNIVHDLAVQGDGKVLIGGDFDTVNGTAQASLARLNLNGAAAATLFDYDGDGRADLSVRRPSDGVWHLLRETLGYTAMQWGFAGDRMVPADYDGDGRTDVAVWRPSTGEWHIHMSQSNTFETYTWGVDGDVPLPSDRDADGKADLIIYRPSNSTWYTLFANGTFLEWAFGEAGDVPISGDFDADGRSDMAVWRPSDGNWHIIRSAAGYFVQTWGVPGDLPVAADFDGDGKTDHAVFRPSTGEWHLSRTSQGFAAVTWGQAGDVPVPADYDGDGRSDVAIFRPSEGNWYIVQSTAGLRVQNFGVAGDVPTQSAFQF